MSVLRQLRAIVDDAGLIGPGVCGVDPFVEVKTHLEDARASGRSGGLGFTFTDPAVSSDPGASFPWARSIVVAAHAYLPEAGSPGDPRPGTGRIARFATADHYAPLRRGLEEMAATLVGGGHRAEVVCDDNRIVDRAVAVRAGIAWWGKSAMVLAPGAGPWMLLGCVVTDAEIEPTAPMVRDCGTCDACMPACPTGAIVAPGVLDARRCIAAALQSPRPVPREIREAVGDRWYGCDECLTACPPGSRLATGATIESGRIELRDVLATADRPLRERFGHFFVPRNDGRFLRRNAIVALGNAPDDSADLVLAGYLGHRDPMLRSHAAWALGRVGGVRARAALQHQGVHESDPAVIEEIRAALGTLA